MTPRAWGTKFPIGRALIALLIVPPVTIGLSAIAFSSDHRWPRPFPGITEWLRQMLEFAAFLVILGSWPGYIAFVVLGLPTLYVLYRLNQSEFSLFALLGLICTSVAWIAFFYIIPPNDNPRMALLCSTPPWAILGLVAGVLTRLVVVGWPRSLSRERSDRTTAAEKV